jgi:hypothetical protein
VRLWSLKISEICKICGEVPARRSSPAQRQGAADLKADASAADPFFVSEQRIPWGVVGWGGGRV